MKKINCLFLSCGTNACYHFIKTLKEKFADNFKIIGADINPDYLIGSCNYLDKFYKVPYSSDDNYYDTILNICKDEEINYIFPSFDIDQSLFYPENKDLIKLGVKSFSTPLKTLGFYKNKNLIYKELSANNFPIPNIYNLKDLNENNKYFVKPINGVGSSGIQILTKQEIANLNDIDNYIIQEICTEPEITLECFQYKDIFSSVARTRIAAKSGVCTKTRIYKDFYLENIAKKFANTFLCPTFFNLQFMKNKEDKFVITDVNLRLAGGMGLSCAAGWDEVSAIANIMLNKDTNTVSSSLNLNNKVQYIVRTYHDIITKSCKNIIAYDLDGTILNSFDRHKKVLSDALKLHNITLDLSDYIEFKRNGKNTKVYLEFKNINPEIIDNVVKFWIDNIEKEYYLDLDYLYNDVETNLQQLSKENELILITARNNKVTCKKQLKKFGLDKYFTHVYIVDSCAKTPELKAKILLQYNVSKMIGDTESDKKACEIANVTFEPVFHGFRNKDLLQSG